MRLTKILSILVIFCIIQGFLSTPSDVEYEQFKNAVETSKDGSEKEINQLKLLQYEEAREFLIAQLENIIAKFDMLASMPQVKENLKSLLNLAKSNTEAIKKDGTNAARQQQLNEMITLLFDVVIALGDNHMSTIPTTTTNPLPTSTSNPPSSSIAPEKPSPDFLRIRELLQQLLKQKPLPATLDIDVLLNNFNAANLKKLKRKLDELEDSEKDIFDYFWDLFC